MALTSNFETQKPDMQAYCSNFEAICRYALAIFSQHTALRATITDKARDAYGIDRYALAFVIRRHDFRRG